MQKFINKISNKLPCREQIISRLYELIGNSEEALPNSIYLYGHTGTGKTSIIHEYFKISKFHHVYVNCIECYTSKILYETILNKFYDHHINYDNNFASYTKCENLYGFINSLRKLDAVSKSYVICLDNAEKIRDMESNILSSFLRLQELTGLNICTILISQLPFEKYYLPTGLPEIILLHCPQYTKNEIQQILLKEFDEVIHHIKSKLSHQSLDIDNDDEFEKKILTIETLNIDVYENYLNIFLNMFYRVCRDLPELRMMSKDCFVIYCEPIINGQINCNDITKLWRHVSKPLQIALSRIYMRIDQSSVQIDDHGALTQQFESEQSTKKLAQSLELPYYAKYLLIAGFLASYNAPKEDRRLFVKNHGKQKKRVQTINANAKLTEKMSTTLGPKPFTIDRLLAIFYAILDEKIGLTCNLLSQISTLINLKFLTFVSGESNIVEGSTRLQCTVSLDFILNIGKIVGFNVRQYLCDFK